MFKKTKTIYFKNLSGSVNKARMNKKINKKKHKGLE